MNDRVKSLGLRNLGSHKESHLTTSRNGTHNFSYVTTFQNGAPFFFLSQRSTSDVGEQSLSSGACLSNCYFCSAELLVFPHELLPSIEVLTRNISFKKCTAILKHRILTLQVKTCSYFKEHELCHLKKKVSTLNLSIVLKFSLDS